MKPLLTFVPEPSLDACVECRISVRSLPYLADHAFQDMVVLPGSFYIETALAVHQELFHSIPAVVRNVTFHHPVVLSLDNVTIRVGSGMTVPQLNILSTKRLPMEPFPSTASMPLG